MSKNSIGAKFWCHIDVTFDLCTSLHLSISPSHHLVLYWLVLPHTHDDQTTMNLHDVNVLDAAVHDGSRWLGCLICPSLKDDSGEQASFNLLTREKVRVWKLKTTQEKNISLSRKSMEGIPIPTSVPAVPTEPSGTMWRKSLGCGRLMGGTKLDPIRMKAVMTLWRRYCSARAAFHIGHALHLRY